MSDADFQLKDYEYVLNELEKSKPNNHLLLGNGFNLSLGVKTDYKSIFERMKKNNQDFETVITQDFDLENFIGGCKDNIKEEGNPHSDFMKRYFHNKIKLDFMRAVTQIVTKEIKNIYQVKNEDIYLLLEKFDSFFTLNYDPFLYQLLMAYKNKDKDEAVVFKHSLPEMKRMLNEESQKILDEIEEGYENGRLTINISDEPKVLVLKKLKKADFTSEMKIYFRGRIADKDIVKVVNYFWEEKDSNEKRVLDKVDDGFGLFGKELRFQNLKTQNLFFLHGAFHIYERGKSIYKITQKSEKALYQRIEDIVEDDEERIICIFSDDGKEEEIRRNDYLNRGLNRLSELDGSMLIIGSSLADNDSHILYSINSSNIDKIYISCSESTIEGVSSSAKKYFPDKHIVFFDQFSISYIKS